MKKYILIMIALIFFSSCNRSKKTSNEINIYSQRHYEVDKKQYEAGSAPSGGLVNLKSFQLTQNKIWDKKAIFLTKTINYLIL